MEPSRDGSAGRAEGIGALLTRFPTPSSGSLKLSLPAQDAFDFGSLEKDDSFLYHALSPETRPRTSGQPTTRHEARLSQRRPSNASSHVSGRSIYPPPSKPLPPLPPAKASQRVSSQDSLSSLETRHFSQSSRATSAPDSSFVRSPVQIKHPSYPLPEIPSEIKRAKSPITVICLASFQSEKKKKNAIHFLDLSATSSILASKHGKNIIKIWSVWDNAVQSTLKFSAYTEAQSRSREYLIRSHAILSEASGLIAIATRFGRSIDIWRWTDKQCLQSIDYADRWAACQFESYETGRGTLAVYHGENSTIDVYTVGQVKKPFSKMRTIDLRRADLPFTLQYPELALSATSPMLVAAAGPRQTRAGHPPPEEEILLVAWEIRDNGENSSLPYKVARPWKHKELDTALPCELATYGSFVVSIWIPASYRAVPMTNAQGTESFHLSPSAVPFRWVLVWDLVSNSTRTFKIPNTASCISPDCRLVAYCEANRNNMGGRGCLAILDVITGKEIWCWPDRDAIAVDSGPKAGFEQFESLDRVTQLAFSADGKFLVLGDSDGQSCMYKIV
ncbi:hypothetical protein AK830_g9705 [Neonectria ditissima]|uniref:Uncharacterized protein n=1 Tax=Neonectria ditissima TaxID=78410 RepID=A0A0P7BBY4_9HYPO|nr:hypothetical protein AK830_g9705 [Neonectria ditissima]